MNHYCSCTECPFHIDSLTIQTMDYSLSIESQNYSNTMNANVQDKRPQLLKKILSALKDLQNRIIVDQTTRIDYSDEMASQYIETPQAPLPTYGPYCLLGTFYLGKGVQSVLSIKISPQMIERKILGICLACIRFEKIDVAAEIAANRAIEVLK